MPAASVSGTRLGSRLKASLLGPGAFFLRGIFRFLGGSYRYEVLLRGMFEELVEVGELDPDNIHTPGIYVQRIIKADHEKRIEQRTTRQRGEG